MFAQFINFLVFQYENKELQCLSGLLQQCQQFSCDNYMGRKLNPLSANPTKWSKQLETFGVFIDKFEYCLAQH